MERNPIKKLINPEFEDSIKKSTENIKVIQELLNDSLKNLSNFIQDLEDQKSHLQTIEELSNKDFNTFSQEDFQKAKDEVEKTKKIILEINNEISELIINKSILKEQIEEFKTLENKFRDILLKTDSENLQ